MKWIGMVLLGVLLAGCAAMEAENASNEPIPPARPDPFGGGIGSSAPPPEVGGSAGVGR